MLKSWWCQNHKILLANIQRLIKWFTLVSIFMLVIRLEKRNCKNVFRILHNKLRSWYISIPLKTKDTPNRNQKKYFNDEFPFGNLYPLDFITVCLRKKFQKLNMWEISVRSTMEKNLNNANNERLHNLQWSLLQSKPKNVFISIT